MRSWLTNQPLALALSIAVGLSLTVVGYTSAMAAQVESNQQASTSQVLEGYATLVYASYEDVTQAAKILDAAITTLVKKPTAEHLTKAKQAWLDARQVYGQTEVFRFYGGPIDDADGPEGHLNGWPMDEAFVDYVEGAPKAGMIQDLSFEITRSNLLGMNERGGEENIATGWHAIEFLLWGQDLSEQGAGNRPHTDYLVTGDANSFSARRAQYLSVISKLLVEHMENVTQAWRPNINGNYRSHFVKGGGDSLRKILIGMGSLSRGETAGERLEVALFSMDQEDEQSCFSDNTHNDIVANSQGILNVWQGKYRRTNGEVIRVPALVDLVRQAKPAQARQTTNRIEDTLAMAKAIQKPFDQEILGGLDGKGRERLEATVAGLIAQSESLVDAANAIGLAKLTLVHP